MCDGGTTTTDVKTGQLSARGRSYESLFSGILMQSLDQAGFEIKSNIKTEWNDTAAALPLQEKLGKLEVQMAKLDEDILNNPYSAAVQGRTGSGEDPRMVQKRSLQGQIDNTRGQLDKIGQVTYTNYEVAKKPDPRVQQAIEKFGEGSFQVQQVKDAIKEEEVNKANAMAGIESSYLKNLQKFVSGDMSYTPEQKAQVELYTSPIRNAILNTTGDLLNQIGDDDKLLRNELNNIALEINKTGFAVEDALKAASIQIDESGKTLMNTLRDVNDSTRARYKFEQDLLFQDIEKKNAQQAALLGLPPGSNLEKFQNAKMKNDALTMLDLELNMRESTGAMGVQSYLAGEKQKISLSRVALAESQGGKREDLAKMGLSVAERTAGKREDVLGARGNALLALEQVKMGKLENLAYGGIPSMISAAQGGIGFDMNIKSAQQALNAGYLAPVTQQLGVEQQRQLAETKTTQNQKKGFLDTFSDIIGLGAGVASVAMGKPPTGGNNYNGINTYPIAQPIQLDLGGGNKSGYYFEF